MSESADAAAAAPRRGRLSLDELAARRGVKPVSSVQDMAVEGLFPDDELDEFIARDRLELWLTGVVVLDSDDRISRTWGQVCAYARRRGRTRPVNDSWIAACCIAHDVPLATLNVKDYADLVEHEGLMLVDDLLSR